MIQPVLAAQFSAGVPVLLHQFAEADGSAVAEGGIGTGVGSGSGGDAAGQVAGVATGGTGTGIGSGTGGAATGNVGGSAAASGGIGVAVGSGHGGAAFGGTDQFTAEQLSFLLAYMQEQLMIPTPAQIASAVLAALQSTTIPVDVTRTLGFELTGDGTEGNPWRRAGVEP